MSEELDQLRAELKALDSLMGRHLGSTPLAAIQADVSNRIEKLEVESADPWRDAKRIIEHCRGKSGMGIHVDFDKIDPYIHHIESENARLTPRVAELESRPVPPLDPKRVRKTCSIMLSNFGTIGGWTHAEPYPLAEPEK